LHPNLAKLESAQFSNKYLREKPSITTGNTRHYKL